MASAQFDYEAAEAPVRELLAAQEGSPRWEMWGEAELASYAMVKGRVAEGAERILRAHGLQDQAGTKFTDLSELVFQAFGTASIQYHFLQDPEGAVRILDQAWSSPEIQALAAEERGHLDLATLYAQAGRPDRARELLEAFRTDVPAEDNGDEDREAEIKFVEAAIALAEGSAEDAVGLYRDARGLVPRCDFCGLPEMGEAFEAATMPDSAMAAYEGYLEVRALFRSQQDNVRLHRVLLGLGRSHEALGQPDRAGDYYQWLLDLWSDADSGLRPRVEELNRKMQALGREAA
jgi:tetratricopeptide (TPR) repeat protein